MFDERDLLNRITVDPSIFGGKPIIRGLRIKVETILALLSQGASREEILEDFADLEPADVAASLAYAWVPGSALPERHATGGTQAAHWTRPA